MDFTRAAADVDPADFIINVALPANAGAERDVTVHWNSGSPLDFRLGTTGKIYKGKTSGNTIPVPVGENATLYARNPGSDADRLLPSAWVEVGSIDASDWLYLNVSSLHYSATATHCSGARFSKSKPVRMQV